MTSMTDYSDVDSIEVKDITENFQDYRKPSLFIGVCYCDWKCCNEAGIPKEICQNYKIRHQKNIKISFEKILKMYTENLLVESIVIGGLEPFNQINEVYSLIKYLRKYLKDDIVIYTGYYPNEIDKEVLKSITDFGNIIIKFGRYIPDSKSRYDDVLGVTLVSENQFAIRY